MITRAEVEKLGAVHAITPGVLSLYPDVIEEMVSRILEDGGQVLVTSDPSYPMAAGLHSSPPRASRHSFPLPG
jgi:hypothetical protein